MRLLAVRDLAFPQWVDAVRHGLITTIMAADGRAITSYAPWLPVERFPYHFGFHTVPASLIRMTGWELAPLLLILGQLLNALVPLSVYAAAWLMTRRRAVGLVAAFLVAFPFLFPGYYATWGRFTQLTGMLVMPPLVALTWLLLRGGRRWRHAWWLVGLLASGLFLIHLRVFLYFLPFPLLVWAGSRFRRTRGLLAAGALTVALVGARAWELFPRASLQRLSNSIDEYNSFPIGYVTAGWERYVIALAIGGALLGLGAWLRRRRWGALPLALAAWVGALFALLAGRRLGLPQTWLVNLNSMYITLFFPFALLIGIALDRLWGWSVVALRALERRGHLPAPRFFDMLRHAALGALLTAALLFGAHNQIAILHPETTLARPADMAGLMWVRDNLPPDARVVVSAWEWLNGAWAGTDGGAWLLPLTGHASSTPPADYQYNGELAESVRRFNEAATAIEDWSAPAAARWLRDQGYTHIFVGARGGFLDPAALARNPQLSQLYAADGVFIFEIQQ